MGRHRTSYKYSLDYAKALISEGEDPMIACQLSAHRFDEKSKQIFRRLRKEEREKNNPKILFYEGPIYLVNINNKKDIKKTNIAIKLNTKYDPEQTKKYIENYYSKDNYRGIIKSADWSDLSIFFKDEKEYNLYLDKRKKNT